VLQAIPSIDLDRRRRTGPVAALQDLAADEDFHGIVVCGICTLCRDMWNRSNHTSISITANTPEQ
jgi:hypothetical protein